MTLRFGLTEPIYRYNFPLTDQDDYKGRITFTAIETKYENLIKRTSDFISTESSNAGSPGFRDGPVSIAPARKPVSRPVGQVRLDLPPSLTFNDGIDYTNADLGALGAGVAAGIQSGKNAGQLARDAINGLYENTTSLVDAIKSDQFGETAQLAVLRTIGKASNTVRGAVEVSTGLTLNPNRRSTLRGVSIRKFTFNFNLIPETYKEAEMIKEIIFFFREQMYPDDVQVGDGSGINVGYRFPNKFRINMTYDGKPIATRILDCFLDGFNTNYNPNSMSFHEDGNFPEVNIALSFIEERTLRKQDIREGF